MGYDAGTMNICGGGLTEIVLNVPAEKLAELFEQKAKALEEEAEEVVRQPPRQDWGSTLGPGFLVDQDPLISEAIAKNIQNEAAVWKLAAMCLPKDGTVPVTLASLLTIGGVVNGRGRMMMPMRAVATPAGPLRD